MVRRGAYTCRPSAPAPRRRPVDDVVNARHESGVWWCSGGLQALEGLTRQSPVVHIPAKVDYGVRALLTLAAESEPATAEALARAQGLPVRFLGAILIDLRRAGLVASQRGSEGGYRLARSPSEIALADVFRALDGPLAEVRGVRPEVAHYDGAAEHLQDVWVAVRASLRNVLERVSLADVVAGRLPRTVARLTEDPDAWAARR